MSDLEIHRPDRHHPPRSQLPEPPERPRDHPTRGRESAAAGRRSRPSLARRLLHRHRLHLLPSDRRSRGIVGAALAFLAALSLGFPVWLSGWSMAPALANGSLMLVDRLEPELLGIGRGDIVVFTPLPHTAAGYTSLTKRVIGLPGDVVTVGGGRVLVNGQPLAEPYVDPRQRAGMEGITREWQVPPGDVFVLGDARGQSLDSRAFGPVPMSRIVGRVWLVVPTPLQR